MGSEKSLIEVVGEAIRRIRIKTLDSVSFGESFFATADNRRIRVEKLLVNVGIELPDYEVRFGGVMLFQGRSVATSKQLWDYQQFMEGQVYVEIDGVREKVDDKRIYYRTDWHSAVISPAKRFRLLAPKLELSKGEEIKHGQEVYLRTNSKEICAQGIVTNTEHKFSNLPPKNFFLTNNIIGEEEIGYPVTDNREITIGIVAGYNRVGWEKDKGHAVVARTRGIIECLKYVNRRKIIGSMERK